MICYITENGATRLNEILQQQEDKALKVRLFVAHSDANEVRYGLGLDVEKEKDEVVVTKAGIEVLLERQEKFLNGVEIDYNSDEDKWVLTKRLQLEF